jgi:hypothetical protein
MGDSYTNPSVTNRVIWDFCFHKTIHETNPWNESFETSMDSRIRSLGFVWIRACLKYVYVLGIRKDSLDLWKQVKSFENQSTKRIHETNLLKTLRICDPNRTFLESGFVITIRNKSMDSRNESTFLRISYTIPASLRQSHCWFDKLIENVFF